MSGTEEDDQPITEEEFARMLGEEDAARANGSEEAVAPAPEAEIRPEEPVLRPEPEPESDLPLNPEDAPVTEIEAPEPELEPETLAEHLAWAERRNLASFEDAAKLAWEQEKFLGKKASEIDELRQQLLAAPEDGPQSAPTRTDNWMAQALSSPDPARYAYELYANGEWGTYEQYMQMWEQIVGETVTVNVHNQILSALGEQEASEPQGERPIAEAFALVGVYDLEHDPLVPTIRSVADELGGEHPLVQGAARGEVMAVSAIVEIARSRTVTRRTVRLDGSPVDEETRKRAASISGSGNSPTRTPPKEDPLAADREEWRRMGVLPVE